MHQSRKPGKVSRQRLLAPTYFFYQSETHTELPAITPTQDVIHHTINSITSPQHNYD